jgi:hypothetical protein
LKEELAKQAIDSQTLLRKNMQYPRPKTAVDQLMKVRRLIETFIGQLTERFSYRESASERYVAFN